MPRDTCGALERPRPTTESPWRYAGQERSVSRHLHLSRGGSSSPSGPRGHPQALVAPASLAWGLSHSPPMGSGAAFINGQAGAFSPGVSNTAAVPGSGPTMGHSELSPVFSLPHLHLHIHLHLPSGPWFLPSPCLGLSMAQVSSPTLPSEPVLRCDGTLPRLAWATLGSRHVPLGGLLPGRELRLPPALSRAWGARPWGRAGPSPRRVGFRLVSSPVSAEWRPWTDSGAGSSPHSFW